MRDWGTSRLSQNHFPVLWVCNWRCQGAPVSEHPAHHCISHIQAPLAAVSTGHVHKSDLWSLVQHEEMRNLPLVTIWKTLGSHSCSMDQLLPSRAALWLQFRCNALPSRTFQANLTWNYPWSSWNAVLYHVQYLQEVKLGCYDKQHVGNTYVMKYKILGLDL